MSGVPSATEIYKEFTVTEKALTVTTLVPGEPPSWQERKPQGKKLVKVKPQRTRSALLATRVLSINCAKTFT